MKILKEVLFSLAIVLVVVLIRTFIVTPAIVNGTSMFSTLNDRDILLVKKYDHRLFRFDIVVIKHQDTMLVKRIIGLPGEHIEYKDSKLFVNGIEVDEPFTNDETHDFDIKELEFNIIPRDYYFVVGDNRDNSQDSRVIGFIEKDDIIGKTNFRLFPFKTFGRIDK